MSELNPPWPTQRGEPDYIFTAEKVVETQAALDAANAEIERLSSNAGLCLTCGAWWGRGPGCESCMEFAEESGWNKETSQANADAEALAEAMSERNCDGDWRVCGCGHCHRYRAALAAHDERVKGDAT